MMILEKNKKNWTLRRSMWMERNKFSYGIKRFEKVWHGQQNNFPRCSVFKKQLWNRKRTSINFKIQFRAWKSINHINDYRQVRWNYLSMKTVSGLLQGTKSRHNDDLYHMNFLHSIRTDDIRVGVRIKILACNNAWCI